MKSVFTFLLLLISNYIFSQELQWSKGFGQDKNQEIISIAVDEQGNSYCLGETTAGTTDLDPGPGVFNLTHGNFQFNGLVDVFLVKLDPDGNFVWGKRLGSFITVNEAIQVKVGSDGNIYTLMQSWLGQTIQLSLEKFSPDGNSLLIKYLTNAGGSIDGNMFGESLDVDANSNVYISGSFINYVVLDPNNESLNPNTTGLGSYVLKINATGVITWLKTFTEDHASSGIYRIMMRPDGNLACIIATSVQNSTNTGYDSGYILYNLDTQNGNIIFEKHFLKQSASAFTVAENGNIAIAGYFSNEAIDVDPSAAEQLLIPNNTYSNLYFLWLNANGEFVSVTPYYYEWSSFLVWDISSDEDNNYYFAATFNGVYDVDPGPSALVFSSDTQTYSMLLKYSGTHTFDTAFMVGNFLCNTIRFREIVAKNNSIYICGNFVGHTDFDPGTGEYFLDTSYNIVTGSDGFAMKLNKCMVTPPLGNTDQYFCEGAAATIANLQVSGSAISWYPDNNSSNSLNSNTLLANGQTYYAAYNNENCTGASQRLAVNVHFTTQPAPPVSQNQQFCSLLAATIANLSIVGNNIKWYSNAVTTVPLDTATLLQNNTIYYASQTVNGCESLRFPVTVTITTTAVAVAASNQTFCETTSHLVSDLAISGNNINVYDSAGGGTILPLSTPLVDGQTYYAVQTINSCESDQRTAINVSISTITPPVGNTSQVFCALNNPTLADFIVTSQNITWYDSASGGSQLPQNTPLTDGATYYATQIINGCESMRTAFTSIINTANINYIDVDDYFCDSDHKGYIYIDLTAYNNALLANNAGYTFKYYTTSNGAASQNNDALITTPSQYTIYTGTTSVYVYIESAGGCSAIAKLTLNIYSNPKSQIADTFNLCADSNITIYADNGYTQYYWSDGSSRSYLNIDTPGEYWVKMIKNYGVISCETLHSFTVNAIDEPVVIDIYKEDWSENNNSITILATGTDNEYSIDGINFQQSNIFNGLPAKWYTIYVRNNCSIESKRVSLLFYPYFFTPNSDNNNDYWHIINAVTEKDLIVFIYDRYGKLIKSLRSNEKGWDGTFNGHPLPTTDYWFVAIRTDGKTHKGHFSLIR